MADKIYCGSGRIVTTKFGELTKISFSQKDIDTLQENVDKGWVNLVLKEKKDKVDGKPTHYLEVDSWKPESKVANVTANRLKVEKVQDAVLPDTKGDMEDELPF